MDVKTEIPVQGTGIRELDPKKSLAEVGGVLVAVEAQRARSLDGLGSDFVTLKIPHSLAGMGLVPVMITDENFTSNAVEIFIM